MYSRAAVTGTGVKTPISGLINILSAVLLLLIKKQTDGTVQIFSVQVSSDGQHHEQESQQWVSEGRPRREKYTEGKILR